jgi:glycosyltransferase involved in cell wall biosynthesis
LCPASDPIAPRTAARQQILIVSDTMPPDPNGIALIAFHTAELLSTSFDVHVIGPGAAEFSPAIAYSRIGRLPLGTPDLHIPRPALRAISSAVSAADRVVVHTPGPLGLAALHYARRIGKHSTLFQHNDYPVLVKYGLPRTLAAPLLSRVAGWVDRWSVRAAARVVAPSGATTRDREVLRLDPPLYLSTPRVSNGHDGPVTVAYHGRVSREKAVDVIVRAIHSADPGHRRIRLLIVGDGSQLRRVLRLADALGVPVEHVPWCADPRRAIIGADIYVTASRTETYSITTLEALGCGLATIARRVGNIPAYVTDGVNGLLFDRDDQLAELLTRLISDSNLRERLAESASLSATSESIWEQFALASARS